MAEKPTKQQIAFQQQLNDLYESGAITLKELTSFMADSNKMTASQIRNAKAHFSELKKITKEKERQLKIEEALTIANEELIDLASKLNSGIKGNIKEFKTIGDKTADVVGNLKKLIKEQVKSGKLSAKQAAEMTVAANEAQQLADSMQVIANSPAAAAMEDLQKAADDAADKIEGLFNKIPGGGMIFRFLGGEELKGRLNKAVSDGVAVMAQKMQEGAKGIDAFKAGFGEFASQVKAIPNIGMVLGIGAAIALAGALYTIFSSISKEAKKLSEETGVAFSQARKLNDEARSVASTMGVQLATSEDITAVQKEMLSEFGTMAMVSTEVAGSVADMGKAFGYGAAQAGKTHAALMGIGASQQEAADLQLETSANALKAGVNIAAVQKDIAQNAKSTAKYFAGNPKALNKAAVEAAKMGVSLSQMASISDKLLDIESSLQSQFEAQAMTGKSLNFDLARQLALEGDIAGATKEILKEVGTAAEFGNMTMVQKKAMAKAAGMEVGELQKSLLIKEKMGNLDDDQLAAMTNLNLSAKELAALNPKQLKAKLAEQQATDKAAASFAAIKNQFMTALVPLAETFGSILSAIAPVMKILGGALKLAFLPITLAGKALQFVLDLANRFKGVTMVIGGLLLNNYLQQKLGTEEKRKQLGLLISEKAGIVLNTAMKWLGFSAEQATTVENKKGILAKTVEIAKQLGLNALKWLGFGAEQATTGEKKAGFLYTTYEFLKQTAMNVLKTAKLGIQLAYNAAVMAGNALMNTGIGSILKSAGALLMKAVAGIWSTLSQIPFGVGLALAGGATAGLFALFGKAKAEKAGDVGISPNGGPIVASPREGTIFQGTINDGVEMSPSAGQPGEGGGGGSSSGGGATTAQISSAQMTQIIEALAKVVTAVQQPAPVVIGDGHVAQIGTKLSAQKSMQA